jgi:hypothetical protein
LNFRVADVSGKISGRVIARPQHRPPESLMPIKHHFRSKCTLIDFTRDVVQDRVSFPYHLVL